MPGQFDLPLSDQHDFFTTPDLLEIGDIPFTSALVKPIRLEALDITVRRCTALRPANLSIPMGEDRQRSDGDFHVVATDRQGHIMITAPGKSLSRRLLRSAPNERAFLARIFPKFFITIASRIVFR